MAQPEISVVMAVYNNSDTLGAALDSILSQEGVALEFIVIDDGSTDGSEAILDRFVEKDSRLKVVHKKNEGLTRSLIEGCTMASAPWIARQDADDVSLPSRLQALHDAASLYPQAAIISSWTRCREPGGSVLEECQRPIDPEEARRQILEQRIGPPAHGSVMFSKELYERVGGYRAEFYYGQDADLWLRLAAVGSVVYVPEVLYEFRLDASSISCALRPMQKQFGELGQLCHKARCAGKREEPCLRKAAELTETVKDKRVKQKKNNEFWGGYYLIGSMLEKKHPEGAADYFRKALQLNPLSFKARWKLYRIRGGVL